MWRLFKNFLFYILPKNKWLKFRESDFVFLINSRNVKDIKNNFPIFYFIPDFILSFLASRSFPFIASPVKGMKNKKGEDVYGYIIACPITGKSMLANQKLAAKKVFQAVKLAEKLGAKIVGLGAFTSSVTDGGNDLIGKTKVKITTGNTFTAAIAIMDIENILKKFKKNINEMEVAIVGCTGSIGQAVSKILAQKNPKKLILSGRTKINLDKLKKDIKKFGCERLDILATNNIDDISSSDLIIISTASAKAVISSHNVKKGAIIYGVSQPSNIPKDIFDRRDIKIFEGGLVATPDIKHYVKMGLGDGVNFACFSETVLLAADRVFKDFVGKADVNNINMVQELSKKYNFKSALFLK